MFAYFVFMQPWRHGYAKEMSKCLLTYLFEVWSPPSVYAEIDTRNLASIRLVESLGSIKTSTLIEADFFKGSSSDEHTFSSTRQDWFLRNDVVL